MKIRFWLVFILIFLGVVGYGYYKATPDKSREKAPQIKVTPDFFDFGKVKYGKVLKRDFTIKNSGEGKLKIKQVSTSCACTEAEVNEKSLPPGEKTTLSVEYDTGAMSKLHGKGNQKRIIFIQSNDPLNPQVEVTIQVYVR